jgi:hypothetical protein
VEEVGVESEGVEVGGGERREMEGGGGRRKETEGGEGMVEGRSEMRVAGECGREGSR